MNKFNTIIVVCIKRFSLVAYFGRELCKVIFYYGYINFCAIVSSMCTRVNYTELVAYITRLTHWNNTVFNDILYLIKYILQFFVLFSFILESGTVVLTICSNQRCYASAMITFIILSNPIMTLTFNTYFTYYLWLFVAGSQY